MMEELLSESNALDMLLWGFTAGDHTEKVTVEKIEKTGRDIVTVLRVKSTLLCSRMSRRKRP